MSTPRQLGVVEDVAGLHVIARDRAAALRISRAVLDEVAGLPTGYSGKLLAEQPMRHFGAVSLGPVFEALGMKIVVVEDAESLRRLAPRLGIDWPSENDLHRKRMIEIGRQGGKALQASRSPEERSARARTAAKARWRRFRAKIGS
jgi:hypothetical protein